MLKRLKILQSKMAKLRKFKTLATKDGQKEFEVDLKIREALEEFRELDNVLDYYGMWR